MNARLELNGQVSMHGTIRAALQAAIAQYPGLVAYDAGAWPVDGDTPDDMYDVRSGRAALIWENLADSDDDNGANAIGEILVHA